MGAWFVPIGAMRHVAVVWWVPVPPPYPQGHTMYENTPFSGLRIGIDVGFVGAAVGASVGESVGESVGVAVGEAVGTGVLKALAPVMPNPDGMVAPSAAKELDKSLVKSVRKATSPDSKSIDVSTASPAVASTPVTS